MLPVTRRATLRHAGAAAMVLAMLCVHAAAASAKTSAQAIASINELRVAHGIPAVAEDRRLTTGCQLHARYMALNGGWDRANAHGETRSKRGYTARGAAAARRSVLSATGWFAPTPWANAPVHLAQVLNPALRRTGYGQESTFICLDTVSGLRSQAAELLTYPGPNATGVPPTLVAAELSPDGTLFTPGVGVGIRTGRKTGPYLMLFTKAPLVSVDFASLTGPAGPVPVIVTGRFVIARTPLAARTPYTASVSVITTSGATIRRDWRFVTGAAVPQYATPTLPLDIRLAARSVGARSRPKLTITTRGAARGRKATLRVRRMRKVCATRCAQRPVGATTTKRLRLLAWRRVGLPRLRAADTGWSVSLTAGRFSAGGVRYRTYRATRTVRPVRPR